VLFLVCISVQRKDQSSALQGFSYTAVCFHKTKPDHYSLCQSEGGLQAVLEVKICRQCQCLLWAGSPELGTLCCDAALQGDLSNLRQIAIISATEQVRCAGRLAYDYGIKSTGKAAISDESMPVY